MGQEVKFFIFDGFFAFYLSHIIFFSSHITMLTIFFILEELEPGELQFLFVDWKLLEVCKELLVRSSIDINAKMRIEVYGRISIFLFE